MPRTKVAPVVIADLPTLTKENIREGLYIINKANPEWGTWKAKKDGDFWSHNQPRGGAVLFEGEFHFWAVVGDFDAAYTLDKQLGK